MLYSEEKMTYYYDGLKELWNIFSHVFSMNKKILIIDDDPAIVDALQIMLEDEGYLVSSFFDIKIVKRVREYIPDLILLDIWMAGLDGRDIAKELKNIPETKSIPIIMISASWDIMKSAIESGADDFLAKPFEIDDLLSKVATYVMR